MKKLLIINNQLFSARQGERGQAAIISVFFFLGIMLSIAVGFSAFALELESSARLGEQGKQSFWVSESGQEDAVYRLKRGLKIGSVETVEIDGYYATSTILDITGDKEITSIGSVPASIRTVKTNLTKTEGAAFHFGLEVGNGGAVLKNQSSIRGNLFSTGPVIGEGNMIKGSVVSAGPNGLVDNIHATSTVWAHTIRNSFIEGDAYYTVIENTTVLGNLFPGSPDVATSSLPISDAQIAEMESAAAAGGTLVCSGGSKHVIKADVTLGPVKIPCDLEVQGSPTITLLGNVWVVGNIEVQNTANIVADASLGSKSVAIIADNPSNPSKSGAISLKNSVTVSGSGHPNSFVAFISQNGSTEQGGIGEAIEVGNTVSGDILLYAGHGEVEIENSSSLREVTAYKVFLKNSSEIIYKEGLVDIRFDSGPGASYDIKSWKEIK